jgi:hypothetical protein
MEPFFVEYYHERHRSVNIPLRCGASATSFRYSYYNYRIKERHLGESFLPFALGTPLLW